MNILFELKKEYNLKNDTSKTALISGGVATVAGLKLLKAGKLAAIAGKSAKIAKSGSGIIVLDPKKKLVINFQIM